jgi:hypothetical protein
VIDVGGFLLRLEQRPVVTATSVEGTAALARRIVEEALHQGGDETAAKVRVLNGPEQGRELSVPAPPGRLVLGRGEDADLTLSDEDLSRSHAEIARNLSGAVLRDLASKNGTFVGDEPIQERRLRDGDEIRLGNTILLFDDAAARRLSEICDAPDESMELPAPPEEPQDEPDAEPARESEIEVAPLPSSPPAAPPARRRAAVGADVFIYVLAGAVLALSIAGLFFLLRAG